MDHATILGLTFQQGTQIPSANWPHLLEKLKSTHAKILSSRLSLFGKYRHWSTFALSKVLYNAEFSPMPERAQAGPETQPTCIMRRSIHESYIRWASVGASGEHSKEKRKSKIGAYASSGLPVRLEIVHESRAPSPKVSRHIQKTHQVHFLGFSDSWRNHWKAACEANDFVEDNTSESGGGSVLLLFTCLLENTLPFDLSIFILRCLETPAIIVCVLLHTPWLQVLDLRDIRRCDRSSKKMRRARGLHDEEDRRRVRL